MSTPKRDRLHAVLESSTVNGIDFIEVNPNNQRSLRVHFLNSVPITTLTAVTITGGESIPTVPVVATVPADWGVDPEGRQVLSLTTVMPGDFSIYTLSLVAGAEVDSYYSAVQFTFKAGCPSALDCLTPPQLCPADNKPPPVIDYLAKDFLSFRQALLEFSSLRYPRWQERSEADFGLMFLEALAGVADELSYYQDRVAAEASLETATQRSSLVNLARLVDYEPQPATSASVVVQLDVSGTAVPTGALLSGRTPDGARVDFEIGTGLLDPLASYSVSPAWNRGIPPYWWNDADSCLPAGATEMSLLGHGYGFRPGQALLIETPADTPADAPLRAIVHLEESTPGKGDHFTEVTDELFPDPRTGLTPAPVTKIRWRFDDRLTQSRDLTSTVLAGNLLPATQGRRYEETFSIPGSGAASPLAIARTGPNGSVTYYHTLSRGPLSWITPLDAVADPCANVITAQPEIRLKQVSGNPEQPMQSFVRSLLDADEFQAAFTLDRLSLTQWGDPAAPLSDYDGDQGDSIRFGNGTFGEVPDEGTQYQVSYRVGQGALGNMAADSLTEMDPAYAALVSRVTNPFAASGGQAEEPALTVRRLAPQAFRAKQCRAVRREDYRNAARTLAWVLDAGAVYRWTGSWLTVFATADPKASERITPVEHLELIELLNRYRLAGYECYAPAPEYVSLDLQVTVCALPDVISGQVRAALLETLSARALPGGQKGFFYRDNFAFGTPLERSRLEAAVQSAYGVAGVLSITYRKRSVGNAFTQLVDEVTVGSHQLLRVDSDPNRPEAGSVQITVEGGR